MPFERHRIPFRNRGEVQVATVGSGTPVVFLHAEGFFGCVWAPIVQRLSNVRAILIDLPGHGCSHALSDAQNNLREDFGSTVVEVLDVLNVSRAAFVGNALGGQCALWMAIDRPDRVDKLVLAGSAAGAFPGSNPRSGISRWVLGGGSPEWLVRRRLRKAIGPRAVRSLSELHMKMYLTVRKTSDWSGTARTMRNRLGRRGSTLALTAEELGKVRAETLVYRGYDDRSADAAVVEKAVGTMADARLHQAPGGPMPYLDDPYRFSEALDSFLH